ncbi:FecR domain-containing protein [Pseudoxanthomonas sp. F37]|uniref:FecR domain-containing protein n=1 Tax=Pseudoxanthomonas TaxID=83618 RepID=UPI001FD1073E|nr:MULTISPECIES: FecR domain-containing protein [Pseudoxanthomonas]UOV04785.1 FecR domain-containing protein [Pseudoxanthomonas mexicana]UOV09798.1 FecR domain-containing protein [Pseudoxanthomonas sp. F37]
MLFLLAAAASVQAQEWAYRVRPGDTLWDVAGAHLKPSIPWQRLQDHNRIANPYQLAPGSTLQIPLAWLDRQPARARVVAVRGNATSRSAAGRDAPVTAGMSLGSGAVLKTSPDASLSLEFADGSRLLLLGDSELLLDRLTRFGRSGMADTRLRLQRGRIGNEVRRLRGPAANFVVDTPSASSAVRGTQFRVEAREGRTHTEVLEGRVAVNARNQRGALLRHGFGAVVVPGQAAIAAVALLPAPDLSRIAPLTQSPRPELAWPQVPGAHGYRVQVGEHRRFDSVRVDMEVEAPRVQLPVLDAGHYAIRVRAIGKDGLEGRDTVTALQVDDQPAPPYSIAPAAGSVVRTPDVVLRWTRAPGAVAYDYEIAGAAGFARPVARARVQDTASIGLPDPLPPGDYAWRIRSIDASGKAGPFGDPLAFTVRPLAEVNAIDTAAPTDTREVTFRWQAGQPGQRYRFQMSRTPDFRKTEVDMLVDRAEATLPRLRGGTWYLRAQTIDVDGFEGPVPAPQQIDVPCRWCRIGAGAGALLILLSL